MQSMTSLCANVIFLPPPGSPSKLKEILIAVIPNRSIFRQHQNITTPRAQSTSQEHVSLYIHPLFSSVSLSFFSDILYLLLWILVASVGLVNPALLEFMLIQLICNSSMKLYVDVWRRWPGRTDGAQR